MAWNLQVERQMPTENVRYDYFACCAIVALMFIPLSNAGNYLRIAIVLLLLLQKVMNSGMGFPVVKEVNEVIGLMVGGTLISTGMVYMIDGMFDTGLMQHELIRLGFNILLILLTATLKIPFDFIFKISVAVLGFHLGVQVIQKTGIFGINDWIRQVYLDPTITRTHLTLSEYAGSNFRSGSIFLNPNVYMVIPCIVLCLILQKNILKREWQNYIYCFMAMVSLFLTGSRTTLFIFAAIIMYLFLSKSVRIQEKAAAVFFAVLFLISMIVFNYDFIFSARVFNVTTSIDGSLANKVLNLLEYLNSANIGFYLFGSIGSVSVSDVQLDSEWGYMIKFYGLVGLFWYYKLVFQNPGRHAPELSFFYKTSRITILLVAVSATVFFCMPIFPYVCLMTMADIDVGTAEN